MDLLCGHKDCAYRGLISSSIEFCSYCLVEHHSRGCKPDANCSKYRKGKRIKIMDLSSNFHEEVVDFDENDDDYL